MCKKLIKPLQESLLERHLCVGCTRNLAIAKTIGALSDNRYMVECKCRRRYVYNKEMGVFQRATFAEEQQVISNKNGDKSAFQIR